MIKNIYRYSADVYTSGRSGSLKYVGNFSVCREEKDLPPSELLSIIKFNYFPRERNLEILNVRKREIKEATPAPHWIDLDATPFSPDIYLDSDGGIAFYTTEAERIEFGDYE